MFRKIRSPQIHYHFRRNTSHHVLLVHCPLQAFLNMMVTINRFWQVLLQSVVQCYGRWKNAKCVWQISKQILFAYTTLCCLQQSIMCPAAASPSDESLCQASFVQCRASLKDKPVQLLLTHCAVCSSVAVNTLRSVQFSCC